MPRLKRCGSCNRMKPLAAFWRRAVSRDGRDVWCTLCRGRYVRQWCADNRDSQSAHHRAYYLKNLEHLRAYNREYQRRRRELMRTGKWTGRRTG